MSGYSNGRGVLVGSVNTTDATQTTILSIPIPASTTTGVNGYVIARRTGGSAGSAEDGAYYRFEAVYKNAAGTPTSIGAVITVVGESQAGWTLAAAVSGTNLLVQVVGAANNNISWKLYDLRVHQVSA